MQHVDFLSRLHENDHDCDVQTGQQHAGSIRTVRWRHLCKALRRPPRHLWTWGKWPRYCPPALKRENAAHFQFVNGILCRCAPCAGHMQVVWPVAKRFELMYRHHDNSIGSHCGGEKLYDIISRRVWYLGLRRDCQNYVASCGRCIGKKDDRGPPPPPILPQQPAGPGDELVIVHMPASRTSGRTLVLTCIDKFTGFLTFYPLQSGSADDVV